MDGRRSSALAAYIRAGIDGPRKQRRVFQNRLQECFPCRALIAARRQQARLIEKFALENSWSATIHDMGLSVTFQRLASESQATSDVTYRESNPPLQVRPERYADLSIPAESGAKTGAGRAVYCRSRRSAQVFSRSVICASSKATPTPEVAILDAKCPTHALRALSSVGIKFDILLSPFPGAEEKGPHRAVD